MEEDSEFLNVSNLELVGDVDDQVASLLRHVRLSRGDVIDLRNLLADLEHALRNVWPGCEVHPFGSIVTGLGIKSSDVDVYVKLCEPFNRTNPVIVARNVLRNTPWKFSNIFAIPAAKVPIVKFFHAPTGCNCDVNFKSEAGVANSKLTFHLLKTDYKALSLAIIVKYWSKVYNFTGTNLLSSYALTMLVIFYLQGINMLAPISELQKFVAPHIVEFWNCAFDRNADQPRAYRDNIYHLLGGFFKYYSFFRFDQYIVSTYLGTPILRSAFANPEHCLREEFPLYQHHLDAGICEPLRIDTLMCIQDPFDHSRNCSIAISQKLFATIQVHFRYAARMYDQMAPDEFLKAVFSQCPLKPTKVTMDRSHKPLLKPPPLLVTPLFKSNKQKKKKKNNKIAKQYIQIQKNR